MLIKTVLLVALLGCVSADIDHSQCKLDLVLCLDNTGSIAYNADGSQDPAIPPSNWIKILDFSQDIVRELTVGPTFSQVGLVDYGQKARIQFGLNRYATKSEVIAAIAKVPFVGDTTNTTGGLYKSRVVHSDSQYGGRDGVSKVVVLVTDGNPNVDADKVYDEANNLRNAGIRTIVVGITFAEEDVVKPLAYSNNDYIYVSDFSDLESVKTLVLKDDSCKAVPTLPPTPAPTPAPPTAAPTTAPKPPTPPPTTPEPIIYC